MSRTDDTHAAEEIGRLRRRVAELESAQVQRSEAGNLYQTLIATANTHMVAVSHEGIYLHATQLSAEHLSPGASPEDVIGQSLSSFYPPDVAENFLARIRKTCETGQGMTEELLVPEKSGARWFWTDQQPIFNAQGEAIGVHVIAHDITERKKNEEQIQRQGDFLHRLIESSVDGILAYDQECRYTVWNKSMERLSGVRKEDVLGNCAFDVFPFLAEIGEDKYFLASLEGKTVVARDRAYQVPETGKTGFFEGHYSPLLNDVGKVIGGLGIVRIITERKEAEEQLREHREKLAHITRVSTMGEIATGIAHEVNQPLAAIANYAYVGKQKAFNSEGDNEPLGDLFDRIEAQAHRAGEIVRRLRKFVKATPSSREVVELNELVEEVIRLVQPDLRLHEVRLELRLDDAGPRVCVDVIQIQQVMINLVLNAIDAMNQIEVEKRVLSISTSSANDPLATFTVCDAGPGLSEEGIEKIFEAFYSTKSQGLGMGLAISRSIIEDHQGHVWLKNNSQRGVTAGFSIPMEASDV